MYKFIAEKTDGNGTITETRTYEAPRFNRAMHPTGKAGDFTLYAERAGPTSIKVNEAAWHYVRVFDASGI